MNPERIRRQFAPDLAPLFVQFGAGLPSQWRRSLRRQRLVSANFVVENCSEVPPIYRLAARRADIEVLPLIVRIAPDPMPDDGAGLNSGRFPIRGELYKRHENCTSAAHGKHCEIQQ